MNEITTVLYAGLANRMRVLASGIELAKKTGNKISFFWKKNSECNVNFEDIFCDIDFDFVTIKTLSLKNFILFRNSKINLYLPSLLRYFFFNKRYENITTLKNTELIYFFNKKKIYINTCHSFYNHFPINEIFVPKEQIFIKINSITNNFNKNTIGLHIRRTDNLISVNFNSISDYINIIDNEIKFNFNVKFYLATDDSFVKDQIIKLYKDRILYNRGVLNRNSSQGIIDAVIDLWCLSKTNKIIGSYYSSYSEIAAELGDINLEILKL